MAVNPDDKGAARLARPGAAFKQYWVLFIGKITAAQPFEYSLVRISCRKLHRVWVENVQQQIELDTTVEFI